MIQETARDFIGGPFDGEMIAVKCCTMSITMPVPHHLRKRKGVPEWAQYRLDGDDFIHIVSCPSIWKCLDELDKNDRGSL